MYSWDTFKRMPTLEVEHASEAQILLLEDLKPPRESRPVLVVPQKRVTRSQFDCEVKFDCDR